MADPTEDLFDGLDGPRALPGPLRDRLEHQLLAAAGAPESLPLGADLDERLRTTLTDPLAAALAGIDSPRALPAELRASLESRLVRRRRNAQRFLGAAAAVVIAVAMAVALAQPGPARHRPGPTPAAAPAPTALSGAGGGVAVGVGGGTVGGGSTGAATATTGRAPAPLAAGGGGSAGAPAYATDQHGAVRQVSPDAGPVSGGTTVTLHGQGLTAASQVSFGGRAASSYTVVSDTTVRAVTPAAAAPGTVDVVVVVKSGDSYRLSSGFAYLPRPAVSSVSPGTGPSAGGTWVTITGGALSRATAVAFGGTAATRVVVVSASQVRALSPGHLAGPVDVTVTTPGGTSATAPGDRYTYLP